MSSRESSVTPKTKARIHHNLHIYNVYLPVTIQIACRETDPQYLVHDHLNVNDVHHAIVIHVAVTGGSGDISRTASRPNVLPLSIHELHIRAGDGSFAVHRKRRTQTKGHNRRLSVDNQRLVKTGANPEQFPRRWRDSQTFPSRNQLCSRPSRCVREERWIIVNLELDRCYRRTSREEVDRNVHRPARAPGTIRHLKLR